jgi:uncharacterized protein with von Willebrand factor type A (vWA) domain
MDIRSELITKYERNLIFIDKFKIVYKKFLDKTGTWDKYAFIDSNISNRNYFDTLNQISEQEYSEQQHLAVKTFFIHKDAVLDYIKNLDLQYNNLKLLYDEIVSKSARLLDS